MEYSVSLYSFYSAIQKGELTPLGCVEKAAELGFDAVEAVDFVNFSGTQEEKKAQALELKQAGFPQRQRRRPGEGNPAGEGVCGHRRPAGRAPDAPRHHRRLQGGKLPQL